MFNIYVLSLPPILPPHNKTFSTDAISTHAINMANIHLERYKSAAEMLFQIWLK